MRLPMRLIAVGQLSQHANEHRLEDSILLAVDQQFREGATLPGSPRTRRSGRLARSRGASGRGAARRGEQGRGRPGVLEVGAQDRRVSRSEATRSHCPRACRCASPRRVTGVTRPSSTDRRIRGQPAASTTRGIARGDLALTTRVSHPTQGSPRSTQAISRYRTRLLHPGSHQGERSQAMGGGPRLSRRLGLRQQPLLRN